LGFPKLRKIGARNSKICFDFNIVDHQGQRKLAWEIFSDYRRWNEFSNIYGQLNWSEGRPWEAGSRLEIEVLEPVKTVVSHVITNCQPAHKVGWIDHSLGVVWRNGLVSKST